MICLGPQGLVLSLVQVQVKGKGLVLGLSQDLEIGGVRRQGQKPRSRLLLKRGGLGWLGDRWRQAQVTSASSLKQNLGFCRLRVEALGFQDSDLEFLGLDQPRGKVARDSRGVQGMHQGLGLAGQGSGFRICQASQGICQGWQVLQVDLLGYLTVQNEVW